ncbi:hypothetical protein Drose_05785 [Dactylosporangium roseum]|uniref:Uncharacterized protein n=1 Tax=Dactylosporangium roseum TaxID=47989 RepID=A0ABY5Z6X0_9ACTN|nr:hypothetical protein [Dactylosporangium roseum]UWZ37781.1 hypothetical protein Drose_05785 [Dactylosporangium roseum]
MTADFTITGFPPHTLTITEVDGALTYTLTCDGVTDTCRAWQECLDTDCDRDVLEWSEEDGDDEPEAHGIRHRNLDMGWSTPLDECWLVGHPDWPEPARELQLGPGVYRVVHRYEAGGDYFVLSVVGNR